jgi:hypothetical protein
MQPVPRLDSRFQRSAASGYLKVVIFTVTVRPRAFRSAAQWFPLLQNRRGRARAPFRPLSVSPTKAAPVSSERTAPARGGCST